MPSAIKIGYRTYEVRRHINELVSPVGAAVGLHQGSANLMHVVISQPPREVANTLLHEVLHGVWDVLNIGDTEHNDEESIVNAMANGLSGVFRDNPGLGAWFAQEFED